jgi:hypothetical protein
MSIKRKAGQRGTRVGDRVIPIPAAQSAAYLTT